MIEQVWQASTVAPAREQFWPCRLYGKGAYRWVGVGGRLDGGGCEDVWVGNRWL